MMTDRRTLLTILAGAAATAPLLAAPGRAQEHTSGWHETFARSPFAGHSIVSLAA